MGKEQNAFQIDISDNVATALQDIIAGKINIKGDAVLKEIKALTEIPKGHKVALKEIREGEDIIKYGIRIGRATLNIKAGSWVHLHNIHSMYDERSSHLNVVTGAPGDITYE